MTARPWKDIRRRVLDDSERRARVEALIAEMTGVTEPVRPAELRQTLGVSQEAMAERLGVSQPNVSQIERQPDPQVSTLRRYLEALGAELELRAVFPQGAVPVTVEQPPPAPKAEWTVKTAESFQKAVRRAREIPDLRRRGR